MATTSPTDAKRKYSWWWDSHICPKNSKWLQENLEDMDSKIKLMIKIIEEDASLLQKGRNVLRRRPELMALLEELYRDLRQAHKKNSKHFLIRCLWTRMMICQLNLQPLKPDQDNAEMARYFLSFMNAGDPKCMAKPDTGKPRPEEGITSMLEQSNCAESGSLSQGGSCATRGGEETAVLQYQQSSARLQNLRSEILHTKTVQQTEEEMQTGLLPSSAADSRLKHLLKQKHDELNEKQDELEKLNISTEEEHLKCMQAEMVSLSLEKKLLIAHDKLSHLALEKQRERKSREEIKVKDIETSKINLQKELDGIVEENKKLTSQYHSSSAVIIRLQDEIISMKNAQRKLEEEISKHTDEKKTLQYGLSNLKEDRSELERKHFSIKEQIQSVNVNLRDGNVELKDIIKNHERTEELHAENLRQLEGCLRRMHIWRKEAALEESCKELNSKICIHLSERAALNVVLENSLSDASAELRGLEEEVEELEKSSESVNSQYSALQSEKTTLVFRNTIHGLERRHSALQQEKDSVLDKVIKLQEQISKTRFDLQNKIDLLLEEGRNRENLQKKEEACKVHEEKLDCLSQDNQKLTEGIGSLRSVLHLDEKYESLDQMKLDIICSSSCMRSTNLLKSLVVTLLEHWAGGGDLRSKRNILKQDQQAKSEELLLLQAEDESRNQRVDDLRAEAKFLVGQLSELQDSRRSLQSEIIKLIQQNSLLMIFEDDFRVLMSEAVSKDILLVIFRSLHEDRSLELKSLHDDFVSLKLKDTTMSICDRSSGENNPTEVDDLGLQESNEMLLEEILKLHGKVEMLISQEKSTVDIRSCNEEIPKVVAHMQMALMNAALFKEKIISAMVQKEVFKEDITRRNSYVDELKDKLHAVEIVKRRLKVDLNGDITMLGSLQTEVSALEKQTVSLANDFLQSNKLKVEWDPVIRINETVKDMELQSCDGTIKRLQNVVADASALLQQERLGFNANLQEARKQIEALKLKEILNDDLVEMNYEQMLKTYNLISSNFFRPSNRRGDHRVHGLAGPSNGHARDDFGPPQSESFDSGSSKQSPAELVVLPRSITTEPHQGGRTKVIQRLSSDRKRLNTLQSSIQELKTNTEASEESELEDAEEFTSADGLDRDNIDLRSRHQRKILERAGKMSEKIGRLEVEMQKVQQALVKYEEEQTSSATSKTVHHRSKVQLVDYLYGRRQENQSRDAHPAVA
ncbi:hypothetical protein ZWY2020_031041 [Hordeum vulgare]|nr:hypothetical protein ZWY2020_031041 [Hordeum vulgare]